MRQRGATPLSSVRKNQGSDTSPKGTTASQRLSRPVGTRRKRVEYCVVTWTVRRTMGKGSLYSARRTNFSNFVPHPSHRYSKMGMLVYSVNSNAILSIHLRTSPGGAVKLFTMIENASHP